MPTIQPVGASSRKNLLLHADNGWGKTSFIGSGGKEYDILLMRPPIDHVDSIIGSGVNEMVVKNWEDIFEGLEQVMYDKTVQPDIFALDSISLLQDVGLDDVYEGILDSKGPAGSVARKTREQFGPDRGEYRVNMWRLAQWVRRAVSAGEFDLIITAHSIWFEPDEGDSYLAPWIQGKGMISKICGMMNIVGYGDLVEKEIRGQTREQRVIHWNKSARYYAKNQFKIPATGESVFPSGETVNPTLPFVWGEIEKGRPVVRGARRRAATPAQPVRRTTRKGAK